MTAPRAGGGGLAGLLWIAVSIVGGVLGALAAWRLRVLVTTAPAALLDALQYLATVVDATIVAGAQWLVFQRYRLDVYWWVPATVIAYVVNAVVVLRSIGNLFIPPPDTQVSFTLVVLEGAIVLAVGGLVVGVAQALVLRQAVGSIAWAWVPATVVGGALTGGLTTAFASNLFDLPYGFTISGLAAIGALVTAGSQTPVLIRFFR